MPLTPDEQRRKTFRVQVLTIALSLGGAAVGTLLGLTIDQLKPVLPYIGGVAVCVCLIAIAAVALHAAVAEYADRRLTERVVRSMPQRVKYVRRKDTVMVKPPQPLAGGTSSEVVFVHEGVLAADRDDTVTHVDLPFFLELTPPYVADPAAALTIDSLSVNSVPRPTGGLLHKVERRTQLGVGGGSPPHTPVDTAHYIIRIPVALHSGKDWCEYKIVLTTRGAFNNQAAWESYGMVMYYYTEELEVHIVPHPPTPPPAAAGAPPAAPPPPVTVLEAINPRTNSAVEAAPQYMPVDDTAESDRAKGGLASDATGVRLRLANPKITYRYSLHFKTQ